MITLHDMFSCFAERNTKHSDDSGVDFEIIKDQITDILRYQARMEDRIKKWRTEAKKGSLGKKFDIPLYKPETWMKESADMNSSENSSGALKSIFTDFTRPLPFTGSL